jgi:nicotinamidase/pyrazinamidase
VEACHPSRRDAVLITSAAITATAIDRNQAQGETMSIKPTPEDVFIIVDVQNDFLPGGALAVKNGDQVIQPINALARKFTNVVQT